MDGEINKLKSVLKSLVVSSPTQVDVRTLMKDYKNMVGSHLPITKYGYKDPVTFLRERCNDSFLLNGSSTNPTLTLIVTDSIKHIDKFVQKQKSTSMVKMKGKRTSIAESKVKPPKSNLIAKSFLTRKLELNNKDINEQTKVINKNTAENKPMNNNIVPNHLNIQIKTNSHDNDTPENNTCPQSALQNFLKKRTALYRCNQSQSTSDSSSEKDNQQSGRQTSSTTSSVKRRQLEELKGEIIDIIHEHPDGVWCTDLLRLYRTRFNRELNFARQGYTSILSLVCTLEHVRTSRQPGGDWLLSDARRPQPARPAPPPPRARDPARPAPADPEDALPGIDYEAGTYPADCLHFLEGVPALGVAGVAPGDMLEVAVAEVYSPSHFWLLRLGERHHMAMEDIMDEMNEYYKSGEGRTRTLAPAAVRAGQYCACLYDGDWHRAVVVRLVDSDTVKVRHIDYGTVERAAAASLRPLRRVWAALPAQATRARLAGLRPPAGASAAARWPRAAAHAFLRLVRDTRLVANVVAVDAPGAALEVLLVDTSGARDRLVGDELVRAGHAEPRPAPHVAPHAPERAEWYLHPSFEALEAADTPSFAELHALQRHGIEPDYVDEYRAHVPPPPPSPPPPQCCPRPSPPRMEHRFTPRCSPPPRPVHTPRPAHLNYLPQPLFLPNAVEPSKPIMYVPRIPNPQLHNTEWGPHSRGVSLSASDCEVFALLSKVDPAAAQRFMLEAITRSFRVLGPPSGTGPQAESRATQFNISSMQLNPNATEFKMTGSVSQIKNILLNTQSFNMANSSPVIRPPPGFEHHL